MPYSLMQVLSGRNSILLPFSFSFSVRNALTGAVYPLDVEAKSALDLVPQKDGPDITALDLVPQKDGPDITALDLVPQKDGPDITALDLVPQKDGPDTTALDLVPQKDGPDTTALVDWA